LLRALAYVRTHGSLIPLILGPMMVTLVFVGAAILGSVTTVPQLANYLLPQPSEPALLPLWWFGVVMLTISATGLAVVVAWVCGNMASAPFYDFIAAKVEVWELNAEDDDVTWGRLFSDAFDSIHHSLLALIAYAVISVGLLFVSLVPVIGPVIQLIGGPIVTVAFIGRELMDVPLSRRGLRMREKLTYLNAHKRPVGGHAAVVGVLLLIPLANLIVTPLAVLGASLLFCDIEKQRTLANLT